MNRFFRKLAYACISTYLLTCDHFFSLFPSVNALIHSVVHDRAMITTPLSPELGSSESEMENYEALLHVAERLSEEKPRGLNKVEINLIPSFK